MRCLYSLQAQADLQLNFILIAVSRMRRFNTATNTQGTRQRVFRIKPRAQNVPKTKAEGSKVVEIARHQKKVVGVKNKR